MNNQLRNVKWVVLWVVLVVVMAVGVVSAERTAPVGDWVCGVGQSCHLLLEEGAEVYVLTADGHVLLEVNGADSVRLENFRKDFD